MADKTTEHNVQNESWFCGQIIGQAKQLINGVTPSKRAAALRQAAEALEQQAEEIEEEEPEDV